MQVPAPLLVRTTLWCQALPALALLTRRNRSTPVRWVAAAALVALAGELLGRLVAARTGNGHWVSTVADPATFTLCLIALVGWQVTQLERTVVRIAIFGLLVAYALLIAFVEKLPTLGHVGSPMYAFALLLGAAWTLGRRIRTGPPTRTVANDFTWILGALVLYGATVLVTLPLGAALYGADRIDQFTQVWEVRAVLLDLVFLAITVGTLCPPAPVAEA
ncbi:MAG TPA: hypothetical protein VFI13_13065 [Gemmatimonadales bacterium]|nr:hypothetical protein [Gemmatimonadales bacterium]